MHKRFKTKKLGNGNLMVTGRCAVSGASYSVEVTTPGWLRYQHGTPVHAAFPELSQDDREFLILEISPAGWEGLLGPFDSVYQNA